MSFDFLLMGAQAAGGLLDYGMMELDYRVRKQAASLEQAQLQLRLDEERLASTGSSLMAVEDLRETLAAQRVMMAAQKRTPGVGSTLAIEQKSVRAFEADERMREVNLGLLGTKIGAEIGASKIGLKGYKAGQSARFVSRQMQGIEIGGKMGKPGGIGRKKKGLLTFGDNLSG